MAKRRISIGGPFYGLDARSDVKLMGTSYARKAENVVVQDGEIRVRPGIGDRINSLPPGSDLDVARVFHLTTLGSNIKTIALTNEVDAGRVEHKRIYASIFSLGGIGAIASEGGQWDSPSMVSANSLCFIFDRENSFPQLTSGLNDSSQGILRMGPPLGQNYDSQDKLIFQSITYIPDGNIPESTSDPTEKGFYDWAFTLHDSDTGMETSFLYPRLGAVAYDEAQHEYGPDGPGLTAPFNAAFLFSMNVTFDTFPRFDEIGIYRRIHDLESAFFFCKYVAHNVAPGGFTTAFIDDVPDSERDSLKTVPTRHNYPPPGVSTGVYHLGRMWVAGQNQPDSSGGIYGDTFDPSLVFWSETNNPEHFFLASFLRMGEHGEAVTALVVFRGNIIVFKERTIHVLVGDAPVWTNEYDALGITPSAPTFTPYVADSVRGMPSSKSGHHGVIDVDNKLWFMGESGPMTFDGSPSVDVAPRLRGVFKINENTEVAWAVDEGLRLLALKVDNDSVISDFADTVFLFAYEAMTPEGVPRITTLILPSGLTLRSIHQGYQGGDTTTPDPGKRVIYIEASLTDDRNEIFRLDSDNTTDGPAPVADIDWKWQTGKIHAGSPGRRKRWHFLTVELDFLEGGQVRIETQSDSFESDAETKDLDESGMVKVRMEDRAKDIQITIGSRAGGNENDVGGVTAMVLEATEIDRR